VLLGISTTDLSLFFSMSDGKREVECPTQHVCKFHVIFNLDQARRFFVEDKTEADWNIRIGNTATANWCILQNHAKKGTNDFMNCELEFPKDEQNKEIRNFPWMLRGEPDRGFSCDIIRRARPKEEIKGRMEVEFTYIQGKSIVVD
jgi:hypothetical protein